MTLLSAKAMAFVLVGMDDPEAALCPHLKLGNVSCVNSGIKWTESRTGRLSSDVPPNIRQDETLFKTSVKEVAPIDEGMNPKPQKPVDSGNAAGQVHAHDKQNVIDHKNLTQNLFNSTAIDDFLSHAINYPSWVDGALQKELERSLIHEQANGRGDVQKDPGLSFSRKSQSLSRFSHESVCALQALHRSLFNPIHGQKMKTCQFEDYQSLSAFIEQSIFYVFGNLEAMNLSFSGPEDTVPYWKGPPGSRRLHAGRIYSAFHHLKTLNNKVLYESLWVGIEPLFSPPAELVLPRSPRLKAALSTNKTQAPKRIENPRDLEHKDVLDDSQVLHPIVLSCHALCAVFYEERPEVWLELMLLRSRGCVGPDQDGKQSDPQAVDRLASVIDNLEDDLYLRFAARLIRLIAARAHYAELMDRKGLPNEPNWRRQHTKPSVAKNLCDYFVAFQNDHMAFNEVQKGFPLSFLSGWSLPRIMLEWARTLLLKEWNGKNEVNKLNTVGACLEFLSILCTSLRIRHFVETMLTIRIDQRHVSLGLQPEYFYTSAIADRLDAMEAPAEWLASSPNPKTVRVLSFPFLFPPKTLVTYFRALNYAKMSSIVEGAMTLENLITRMMIVDPDRALRDWKLRDRLKTALSSHFVLEVRRDKILTDALDQLWRRERRELLRPLKVRIGTEEGEQGVDHGGVQQEFFRVAIAEALSADYGR